MDQRRRGSAFRVSATLVVALAAIPASAYKLAPQSPQEVRKLNGVTASYWKGVEQAIASFSLDVFTEPVHEEVTNRIYGCDGGELCEGAEAANVPPSVLAGVRWNDDPPFRLSKGQARGLRCVTGDTVRFETQPACWGALFWDASKGAARGEVYGPGHAMLYRSHFGDLQFLHAMASRDREPASETKARLMDWFQFAWRTASREYTLDTRLKDVPIPTIQAAFGKTEWRVQDLYAMGATNNLRREIDNVAFGSLLHTLQDSFAAGHVEREESSGTQTCTAGGFSVTAPGSIISFHAYNRQSHEAHARADSQAAFITHFQQEGDAVDLGRAVLKARQARLTWEQVEPLFDCMFTLRNAETPAGPGDF